MKNCPSVSTIAAHLNNTIILTQTPVSSGGNGTLTSPVLGMERHETLATPRDTMTSYLTTDSMEITIPRPRRLWVRTELYPRQWRGSVLNSTG